MRNTVIRNFKLQRAWAAALLVFLLISVAVNTRGLRFGWALLLTELALFALALVALYRWSIANRVELTDQELSFKDWAPGVFYDGLAANTVETKIKLEDIKEVAVTTVEQLRKRANAEQDALLGSELRPPAGAGPHHESRRLIFVRYKDGRFHLSNAQDFPLDSLQKLAKRLRDNNILAEITT